MYDIHRRNLNVCIAILLFVMTAPIAAAPAESDVKAAPTASAAYPQFKPVVAFQTWVTRSMDEKKNGVTNRNRGDVSFRRFRFGAGGSPSEWLDYTFQLYLDRLGEDEYAATKGSYGGIGIWNAMITAKLVPGTDIVDLHAGYYWAAISRECNTGPWAVGSFDKTQADLHLRSFTTGKSNGIESGIGIGGMKQFGQIGISYRAGTWEPQSFTSAKYASRLYTGRVMFSIGDPEQTRYGYMLSGNQWGKRTGITIGAGAATQHNGRLSDTLYFDMSNAYGGDLLINWKGMRIDGEYFIMHRTAAGRADFDGTEWHLRGGYGIPYLKTVVEPCICYDAYNGEGSKTLFKSIGDDNTLDFGVNWYLRQDRIKLSLHWLIQDGTAASNTGDVFGTQLQLKL